MRAQTPPAGGEDQEHHVADVHAGDGWSQQRGLLLHEPWPGWRPYIRNPPSSTARAGPTDAEGEERHEPAAGVALLEPPRGHGIHGAVSEFLGVLRKAFFKIVDHERGHGRAAPGDEAGQEADTPERVVAAQVSFMSCQVGSHSMRLASRMHLVSFSALVSISLMAKSPIMMGTKSMPAMSSRSERQPPSRFSGPGRSWPSAAKERRQEPLARSSPDKLTTG